MIHCRYKAYSVYDAARRSRCGGNTLNTFQIFIGGVPPSLVELPDSENLKNLPVGERQRKKRSKKFEKAERKILGRARKIFGTANDVQQRDTSRFSLLTVLSVKSYSER